MFLIISSRSGVGLPPVFRYTRSLREADQLYSIGWDGPDFEWSEDAGGWSLRQGICVEGRLVPGVMRVEISFQHHSMTLTITNSSVSGGPIYYYESPAGDIIVGSRVQILRQAGVPIEADPAALPEFLAYRCVLAPATLFRSIKRVPHGGVLSCSFGAGRAGMRLSSLADRLMPGGVGERDLEGQVSTITERVSQAIHPLAAIPNHVAMLLSGGIDSSIICRLAERDLGLRETISTGYPFEADGEDVERRYALTASIAMRYDYRYYESTTPQYLAGLVEAIHLAEAPVSHLQSVCMHLLAKNGITSAHQVVLQGLGAGGCVGNFRNFLFLRDKPWARALAAPPLFQLLSAIPPLTGRGQTFLAKLRDLRKELPLDDPENPIWKWHQYGDVDWICSHYGITPGDVVARHRERVSALRAGSLYDTWALYSLLGDEEATLSIWSAMAEGTGKTFFFPFYDESFLQAVMSIPWSVKLGATENSLRKAMAKGLGVPDFILNRRKSGFGIRRSDWALEGGVFDPFVPLMSNVLGEKEIRDLRCREPGKAMLFWNYLNYALWKRLCVDGETVETLCGEITGRAEVSGV